VKTRWEDLAARTRGLATHLLGPAQLADLATQADLPALADALRALGFPVAEERATMPERLELAVRRVAGARLWTLARWAGPRNAVLAVVFEDEDRRSLRALLRGAVLGPAAPPSQRLGGLIPTPELPERALAELARQPTAADVVTLLTAWRNPYGPPLAAAAAGTAVDLLALEHALNRTFAERARRGARAARSRDLSEFVRDTIDIENALAAFVMSAAPGGATLTVEPEVVPGGKRITQQLFLDAVGAAEPRAAARLLAARLAPLLTADMLESEAAILNARRATLRQQVRRNAIGAATVLLYVLDLRAEALALQRIIWGLALAAPRSEIARGLVATR
jgi:vacuolar-type H+-ATPase subunit C/Vma6